MDDTIRDRALNRGQTESSSVVRADNLTDYRARRLETGRSVMRRAVAHIAAGGTTDLAASPMENDPAAYCDPARADLEKRELFRKLPLVAGLSRDIPHKGDTLLLDDADCPIVIVRQEDGGLLGFLNMCTHRSTRLVDADRGVTCSVGNRLTCPFHGWTFDLAGRLCGIPGSQFFGSVDASHRQLVRVPVSEWSGIVFVQATPGGQTLDIAAHLGSFAAELAQLELARAIPLKSSILRAKTNWKLALDTYCEGYHFAKLHASTIGITHFSNIAVFDAFEPHWRIFFPERSLASLLDLPESEWPDREYGGIHFIFPNTIVVTGSVASGDGFLRMFRIFPGATPGEMVCHISAYLLSDGRLDHPNPPIEDAASDAESIVTQEDYQVAAQAYVNLAHAPSGFKLVYGRNEIALQALHRSIERVLRPRR
jgi:phenylpropionate dioxygenase-like ring-hydroxylating dioxygenase large terminal subunit